jgi:hypothetical protein
VEARRTLAAGGMAARLSVVRSDRLRVRSPTGATPAGRLLGRASPPGIAAALAGGHRDHGGVPTGTAFRRPGNNPGPIPPRPSPAPYASTPTMIRRMSSIRRSDQEWRLSKAYRANGFALSDPGRVLRSPESLRPTSRPSSNGKPASQRRTLTMTSPPPVHKQVATYETRFPCAYDLFTNSDLSAGTSQLRWAWRCRPEGGGNW